VCVLVSECGSLILASSLLVLTQHGLNVPRS
jgi:hypothetical protein